MREADVEGQFESMAQQAHAARLGMWIFLASEILLFAGLFALFVTYRTMHPGAFADGVRHNTKLLGSINTGVLLVSSYLVASSVHSVREGRLGHAKLLIMATIAMGGVFLVIKFTEYAEHFREGIYPGGKGEFFAKHAVEGLPTFWTLYFFMTGLHAIHVTVGMILLSSTFLGMHFEKISARAPQRVEIAAIYWHLVDTIWIFLWPLLYLAP
ncbi:MAG: cytochrome c oxidase subunit 3 [Polyangiaceae bacterium]